MKAKPDYNSGYLIVMPKHAGHFGNIHISSVKYDSDKHLQSMKEQIERHVDKVDNVQIKYETWVCSTCGDEYETQKSAEDCCQAMGG